MHPYAPFPRKPSSIGSWHTDHGGSHHPFKPALELLPIAPFRP